MLSLRLHEPVVECEFCVIHDLCPNAKSSLVGTYAEKQRRYRERKQRERHVTFDELGDVREQLRVARLALHDSVQALVKSNARERRAASRDRRAEAPT